MNKTALGFLVILSIAIILWFLLDGRVDGGVLVGWLLVGSFSLSFLSALLVHTVKEILSAYYGYEKERIDRIEEGRRMFEAYKQALQDQKEKP